ncbi:MAG TPA: hypothetical protein EYQ53_04400 [Candidatus Poseidoniales archaeon]|jgi:hypothetical protein|nr:MAG: hypothetical protein CXT69_04705 [Euryarchaeota archaeon]HIG03604.1 hypothetical protein [Candidatus Poseidoniales archaeon]HIK78191.1 hypothetical protein [Candidatus Poseidoniales archaeon]
MFSDPKHLPKGEDEETSPFEDCLIDAILDDKDPHNCFANRGEEVFVWPNGGGGDDGYYCCSKVFIDSDRAVAMGIEKEELIRFIREYVRKCQAVNKIIITGSLFAGNKLGVLGTTGRKNTSFGAFIAGINVLKANGKSGIINHSRLFEPSPLSVVIISKQGKGPTTQLIRHLYR